LTNQQKLKLDKNKEQRSFFRDTAGSRTKKNIGREKAQRIRKISKEKMLLKSNQKLKQIEKQSPKESLNDIILMADQFWENCNLNEKVQPPPKRIKQTKTSKRKKSIKENKTFSTGIKSARNNSNKKFNNGYFQNKFKDKLNNVNHRKVKSTSKKRRISERIGMYLPYLKLISQKSYFITKGYWN